MKRTVKNSVKHTFFKYCDGCDKKFKPNGKGQRICEKCKAKRRAKRLANE